MRNRTIRDRFAALTVMGQRILPSSTAINKVSYLASRFEKPYNATEKGRNQVIEQFPTPEGWDKPYLPTQVAEARQIALEKYLDEDLPIKKIPEQMRLTSSDMPQILKNKEKGGEDNAAGVADIIRMLGTLYKRQGDELVTEQTDGLEPDDDDAPAKPVDPMAPPE